MQLSPKLKYIIAVALITLTTLSYGRIELNQSFETTSLWDKVATCKDFKGDPFFDYNYVRNLPFKESGRLPNDTIGAFWIKIPVTNTSNQPLKLVLSTSRFQAIQLYYKDVRHRILSTHGGINYPFEKRNFVNGPNSDLVFSIPKNSEQDLYLRVTQTTPMEYQYAPVDLKLTNFESANEQSETSKFFLFFFIGAITLMTLYNLSLYFVLRKGVYIHYILNNVFILLFVVAQSGMLEELFFKTPRFHEKILLVCGNFAFIFYMTFSKSILNFRRYDPPWDNRINIALIIWPFLLTFLVADLDIIALAFGSIGAIVGYGIVVVSCVKAIRAGSKPAYYFLAGNILYYIAIIISILQINQIIPADILGLTSIEMVEIGTMFQLALFSLTLGATINIIREKLMKKEIDQEKQKRHEQIRYAHLVEQKNIELESKVIERTKELAESSKIIERKNEDITASMNYARRIQNAILPNRERWDLLLKNSFCLYIPKDIISGDFYWVNQAKESEKVYFAAADCTGHGIPGAMVSVVGVNSLNRCINERKLEHPASILDSLTVLVEESFESNNISEEEIKDGMDIALCSIEQQEDKFILEYAGANNPLWLVRNSKMKSTPLGFSKHTHSPLGFELYEYKADKQPIGKFTERKPFTNHTVELQKGDQIYLFSDGYADQFGGPFGKKFKLKNLRETIFEIQDKSPQQQKAALHNRFRKWKGVEEQVDDVCILGVRV